MAGMDKRNAFTLEMYICEYYFKTDFPLMDMQIDFALVSIYPPHKFLLP